MIVGCLLWFDCVSVFAGLICLCGFDFWVLPIVWAVTFVGTGLLGCWLFVMLLLFWL